MMLRALDQMHVSSVKADSLRPGEVFEVSDEFGNDLLNAHPGTFERVDAGAAKAERELLNKAEPPPPNKAPAAKPAKPPRTKRGK